MKAIWPFVLSVFVFVASSQAADKAVRLVGVTSGLGLDIAIIEAPDSFRKTPVEMILAAGQAMNGVEVAKIEAAKGTVSVYVDGEARTLVLEADKEHPSTNTIDRSTSPLIHFHGLSLESAINLYNYYINRTIMQHPQLGNATFSVNISLNSKAEAAAMFEKMFNEQNIATVPDGEHFVMIVPFALTNTVIPRAISLPHAEPLVPEMSINFRAAPVRLVVQAYADYVHKTVMNRDESIRDEAFIPFVTFAQRTPLSKEEICYALETQLAWRGIRFVPEGVSDLKIERIPAVK
jgi:hypothetical protein